MKQIKIADTPLTNVKDVYGQNLEVGDVVVYTPSGRWSGPKVLKVLRHNVDGQSIICVCVNNRYYSSKLRWLSVLIQRANGSPVTYDNFDLKGRVI